MTAFQDLLTSDTITGWRNRVIGWAQGAGLDITAWEEGDTAEQTLQTFALGLLSQGDVIAQAIRGFASLDTSTDPGDVDPFDEDNEALTPEPGFLSNLGANVFGTDRAEETFGVCQVLFDNSAGAVARTFAPEGLVWTWTGGAPPSPAPTYRNPADETIYTNPDGTVTVPAGATLSIPVRAEEAGSRSNAGVGELTLTTTLVGVTATNTTGPLGRDREAAPAYRTRCRQASSRVSLGGPSGAYEYFSRTQVNGDPLLNASGTAVNITRVQVTQESSTGIVDAFFASPSGAASAEDVTAANDNIEKEAFAVPDAITYTGASATEVSITVSGTARLQSGPGVSVAEAQQAIVDALTDDFSLFPIGGRDQVEGAGVIYSEDLQAIAACSYPGLYNLVLTAPLAATTPLAKGQVATLDTAPASWTITLV